MHLESDLMSPAGWASWMPVEGWVLRISGGAPGVRLDESGRVGVMDAH